ncbi:hypothetical protein RJT34_08062 [Clitoria ternatea]|uniref:Uncharacterized protein n=1 Tax=Clitoria ternatea TaxID=43366 RepID=A0AAN9K576_CLITE
MPSPHPYLRPSLNSPQPFMVLCGSSLGFPVSSYHLRCWLPANGVVISLLKAPNDAPLSSHSLNLPPSRCEHASPSSTPSMRPATMMTPLISSCKHKTCSLWFTNK